MYLQTDPDVELVDWVCGVASYGGDFLNSIARAAAMADSCNYQILRPALIVLKAKYPEYVGLGRYLGDRDAEMFSTLLQNAQAKPLG